MAGLRPPCSRPVGRPRQRGFFSPAARLDGAGARLAARGAFPLPLPSTRRKDASGCPDTGAL
ncbi:Uncharacterised protein [Bordetella pertussis]|nr:Uncharacterised protein [Bordetella pertussis]